MARFIKYAAVLVVILVAVYQFVFGFAIPTAARTNIPYKWNNVPLGQKRGVVHSYIGVPTGGELWDIKGDEWSRKVQSNTILLKVTYNNDTIADRYRIVFLYRNWLGTRRYVLAKDTLAR